MKKSLFTTTAFTSMVLASVASAETKVFGDLETTFYSSSEEGINSYRAFGQETNIGLKSSMDLENGLTVNYGFKLELGNSDTRYLTVGSDTVKFSIADDNGNNISSSVIPHIGDQIGSVVGSLNGGSSNSEVSIANARINPHNEQHVSLDFNVAGGTLTARYTPSDDNKRQADNSTDTGSSKQEYVYAGSLGVEGLKIQLGLAKENEEIDTGKDEGKAKKAGISYNFGQFAVGAEMHDTETAAASGSQLERDTVKYSVTFAANDNLSFGLQYAETERNSSGTKLANDEEIIMASVGYNFGGLGIELNYADVDHVKNAASTDAEILQIRTIQKF